MAETTLQFVNEVQLVPIDRVRPNAYNPNRLTKTMFASLVDDIKRNGFVGAIVCFEERELKDALDILKLPRDLDDKVAAAAAAEEAEAPVVLKFVVTRPQADVVNAAIEKAARKRRGDGIAAVAAEWLEARRDG